MGKRKLLNVKTHLKHLQEIFEGLDKYGYVPAVEQELRIAKLINVAILEAHSKKKTRKDIYISRK